MTAPPSQTPWREAALIAFAAAAYRCAFWLAMPRVIDTADAIHYLKYAEQLGAQGFGDLDPRITPLFPALTALVAALGIEVEFAARLVSLAAGVLTAPAVYWLALTLFDRTTARVAALAVAVWPWLADYSCRVGPEALAVLFWILGAAFVVRAVASRHPLPAPAFACWFVVHLTRPEGTVLLLAVPILAAILYPGLDIPARLRNVAPFVAAAVIGLAAYSFAMGAATGQASVSGRVPDMADSLRHVFVERGSEMASAFLTLFTELLPVMLGPVLLLFAGAGLFMRGVMPRSTRGELMLIAVCTVQFACAVLSTYAEPRYLMAVVIVGAIYAARGIVLVGRQAAGTRASLKHAPLAALIATMLFGTAVTLLSEYAGRVPREPREYKIAGLWMRENLEPGLIFTRKPQIGFYADMPTTGPEPSESLNQAIARARESGVEYVVIDERYTAQMAPALQPLLDPANAPDALEVIRADLSPYEEARVVIYRLRETP